MQLYSTDLLQELTDKVKRKLVQTFVPLGVAVAVCVVLCILSNHDIALAMQIASTVLSIVVVWYVIASLWLSVVPCKRRKLLVSKLINGEQIHYLGEANLTGKSLTLSNGICVDEVAVDTDDGTSVLYWEKANGEFPFDGKTVEITTVYNYIYSCEVKNEI